MQDRMWRTTQAISISFAATLMLASLIVSGCSMTSLIANNITNSGATSTVVPVTITDAPSDQVIAASLTLNSIVLTNSAGKTTSILSAPLTFEAAHLDAVQEPLFSPSIPEDTYANVLLTYSNAQVAYIDPVTKQVVLATATLANNSQTVAFATPITVNNTRTSLLVDFQIGRASCRERV